MPQAVQSVLEMSLCQCYIGGTAVKMYKVDCDGPTIAGELQPLRLEDRTAVTLVDGSRKQGVSGSVADSRVRTYTCEYGC